MSTTTPLTHFIESIFSDEKDSMPMLAFYGDDSGTHQSSRTVVVAGYVGQVRAWKKFSREWNKVLQEFGVQQMHRADLEAFGGEYKRSKGWNEERRIQFLQRLNPIIRAHTKEPIGSAVIVEDFDSIMPDDVKNTLGGAYGWCAYHCIVSIKHWCMQRNNYNHPLQYVFEAGTAGHGQVGKLMEALYSNRNYPNRFLIKGWSFQDKNVTPLQAADVLAYEGVKHINNQVLDNGQRAVRISFSDIVSAAPPHLRYWDRESLLQWLEENPQQLRDNTMAPSFPLPAVDNRPASPA